MELISHTVVEDLKLDKILGYGGYKLMEEEVNSQKNPTSLFFLSILKNKLDKKA